MHVLNRLLSVLCISSAVVSGSLLHPVVSGQIGTYNGHEIGTALVGPAVLFGVLAVLLGLVAFREHIPEPSRLLAKRVAAVSLASLVIVTAALSGVGGGVGTAEAAVSDCTLEDVVFGPVVASYNLLNPEDSCGVYTPDSTANQTATDLYAHGLSTYEGQKSYTTQTGNFLEDGRTVANSKAKIVLHNQLANNATRQEAKDAVNESVENYYSQIIRNSVEDWNARASQVNFTANAQNGTVVLAKPSPDSDTIDSGASPEGYQSTSMDNYTLPNGNTTKIAFLQSSGLGSSPDPTKSGGIASLSSVYVDDPDSSNYDRMLKPSKHKSLIQTANTQESNVQSNMLTLVDEIYNQNISATQAADQLAQSDPSILAEQASTDFNSTGYNSFAAIQLAAMGYNGSLNNSHVVELSDQSDISGTLYYTDGDLSQIEKGKTYDPSNYTGRFYIAHGGFYNESKNADEEPGIKHLQSNFTVLEQTNVVTGESKNTTNLEQSVYESYNASTFAEQMQDLIDLREEYDEERSSAGIGGIDLGGTGVGIGVALAAVLVLMIATRN